MYGRVTCGGNGDKDEEREVVTAYWLGEQRNELSSGTRRGTKQ